MKQPTAQYGVLVQARAELHRRRAGADRAPRCTPFARPSRRRPVSRSSSAAVPKSRVWWAAVAVLLLCVRPATAAAQGAPRGHCDSAAAFTPAGEGGDTVYLAVARAPEADSLPTAFAASVLDAVAEEFRLPAAMTGAALSTTARMQGDRGELSVFRPALGAALLVEFKRDGRLGRTRAAQRSLVDAADVALYRAVTAADSAHSFYARDRGPSVLPAVVRLTLQPDSAEARRAVAVLRQPRYQGAANSRLLTKLPEPESPEARAGIFSGRAEVAFEYVIDVTGRPVPGTERLASYSNPALAGELYRWLRDQARWAPAQLGGCPVRQLVRERFVYDGSHAWFAPR